MIFRFESSVVSRSRNESVAKRVGYIFGEQLYDRDGRKTAPHHRDDVIWTKTMRPEGALQGFENLQSICDRMEQAEVRKDARIARQYIASLPNGVPNSSYLRMLEHFCEKSFVSRGLIVIVAIHDKRDPHDAKRNNPHAHIIVSTRKVEQGGFCLKKERILDSQNFLKELRERWAEEHDREFERYNLPCRLSPDKQRDMEQEKQFIRSR